MMATRDSSPLLLKLRWNDMIEVSAPHDARTLVYRHQDSLPKSGFHPLTTPRGHVLTGWEMSDHVWHRGLWFAIKFVNKDNFWEERSPFGVQTFVAGPRVEALADDAARISLGLRWDSPTEGPLLSESRTITTHVTADGITMLDWAAILRAEKDVTLDRTPFTTWGGYGGLALRAARELHEAEFLLPDGRSVSGINGDAHPWVVLQSRVDGGADQRVSLGIIDHPQNPAAPVPWYAKSPPGQGFTFLNAAFLFHGPIALAAGQSLRFSYRVFYRDGLWTSDEFSALAEAFRQGPHIDNFS